MAETFNTRHSLTGALQRLTADQISVFPDYLEIVPDDAKPYVPGMFKPGKVGEHKNPEPPTDEQLAAQAELDATLETHSPRSKAAREAKAEKEAADAAAAEAQAKAEADAEAVRTEAEGQAQ